jgi:3'-phosphoadenosine 5'-phosphosulfate sulfotransferase (PAPS reductase)/FAD synthetase
METDFEYVRKGFEDAALEVLKKTGRQDTESVRKAVQDAFIKESQRLIDEGYLPDPNRMWCHDCKKDQPTAEHVENVSSSAESRDRRVIVNFSGQRRCQVCNGSRLGLYIFGTVDV